MRVLNLALYDNSMRANVLKIEGQGKLEPFGRDSELKLELRH